MLDDRLHRKRLNNHDTPAWPSGSHTDAPRRTPRLADQLYAQLVNQIVRGTLMTGQRLPSENRLSSEFGVSRPVIREAIARLQADGLVTTRHGSGTFVVGQPKDQAIKLAPIAGTPALVLCFELRTALECETAILAASAGQGGASRRSRPPSRSPTGMRQYPCRSPFSPRGRTGQPKYPA